MHTYKTGSCCTRDTPKGPHSAEQPHCPKHTLLSLSFPPLRGQEGNVAGGKKKHLPQPAAAPRFPGPTAPTRHAEYHVHGNGGWHAACARRVGETLRASPTVTVPPKTQKTLGGWRALLHSPPSAPSAPHIITPLGRGARHVGGTAKGWEGGKGAREVRANGSTPPKNGSWGIRVGE